MTADAAKEMLFEYIRGSDAVQKMVAESRFDLAIRQVVSECYDRTAAICGTAEAPRTVAIVLLHYMLTGALIPSQRKAECMGMEIDVVVPDVRTLARDPRKALILHVAESSDVGAVLDRVEKIRKIQPIRENVWVTLPRMMPRVSKAARTFVISKECNTFADIVNEVARFTNESGAGKFKILKV